MKRTLTVLGSALLGSVLVACGGGGSPTGATCDTQAMTLTYDNFGKEFMDTHCIRCHSSTKTGADRHDAPNDENYDTVAEIRSHKASIDKEAGSGPDATNTSMPDDSDTSPTTAEREMLAQWLACGAP